MSKRAVKRDGEYRLYKVGAGMYQLWFGTMSEGVLVRDDVAHADDFLYVVWLAREEMAALLASARAMNREVTA